MPLLSSEALFHAAVLFYSLHFIVATYMAILIYNRLHCVIFHKGTINILAIAVLAQGGAGKRPSLVCGAQLGDKPRQGAGQVATVRTGWHQAGRTGQADGWGGARRAGQSLQASASPEQSGKATQGRPGPSGTNGKVFTSRNTVLCIQVKDNSQRRSHLGSNLNTLLSNTFY